MWSFLQDRRLRVACFSANHSPAPQSFTPVLSTSRCSGSALDRGRGTSSVSARRLRGLWSGTGRSRPSRRRMEPISPSVWRRARRNTARKVRAVVIARGEYQGCPPRVVRGAARHPSITAALNHTVRLPRWRKLASYSRQFVTLCFCLGMWCRRSWFSLNGKVGIRGSERRRSSYRGPICRATGRIRATAPRPRLPDVQTCTTVSSPRELEPEAIPSQDAFGYRAFGEHGNVASRHHSRSLR